MHSPPRAAGPAARVPLAILVALALAAAGAPRPAAATPLEYLPVGDPLEAELRLLDVLGPSASGRARFPSTRPLRLAEIGSLAPAFDAAERARAVSVVRLERALRRDLAPAEDGPAIEAVRGRTAPRLLTRGNEAEGRFELSAGAEGALGFDERDAEFESGSGVHLRGALETERWLAYSHLVVGRFDRARTFADPLIADTDVITFSEESYLAYAAASGLWGVQFGRSRWHWGPGDEGSLLLSKTSAPLTALALRASLPALGLTVVALNATLAPAAGEQLAAHRLEWRPRDGLTLGASEAARYRASGWRPAYALGVVPYVIAQRIEVSDEPDSGAALRNNVLATFDAAWRVAPGTRIYAELLLDDLSSRTDDNPDKLAWQAGVEGAGTALGTRLAWGVEWTRLSRWVYTSYFGRGLAADGRPIGFPTGPDARRVRVRASCDLGSDWQLLAAAARTERGESGLDQPFVPGAPRPDPFDFAGVVEHAREVEIGVRWWPMSGVDAAIRGAWRRVENAGHAAGATDDALRMTVALRLTR